MLMLPVVKAGGRTSFVPRDITPTATAPAANEAVYASTRLYDSLQLDKLGLSREALLYAYKGQLRLKKRGLLDNADVLTVCDFTQPSTSKRMYILDVKRFKLLMHTYVAHGKNSGLEYASRFSNSASSHKSSLGFYITRNIYRGRNGLSLRLIGLDRGFNDKAESRALVVHGARYIGEQRADAAYMGRSFGCPAVPQKVASQVIDQIKGGTCLFIYYSSPTYLRSSKILNG